MFLHRWLATFFGAYAQYTWMVHGVIIFIIAAGVFWLQRKIIKRLHGRFIKTVHIWDDTLLSAVSLPLSLLVWIFAATLFGEYILIDWHQLLWSQTMVRVRSGCFILLLVWFFWRYLVQVEHRLLNSLQVKKNVDITTVSVAGRCARIVLATSAVLILLEAFGIPLGGVIAFGGGGAIVMGIAAQQLLANWFGGLMIFLDKPFKLGEWIQSPDRNIEGRVTRIGWRTTKVMTLDNRPLYIPNALFNQVVIINPQRMTHRRIDATIGIRYDDAHLLPAVIGAIEAMLRQHPNIDQRETLMAHLINFGSSSLDINIYCFTQVTRTPDWRDVQQDVFFKVIALIKEHRAQFAFPTVTTRMPDGITIRGDVRL